MAIPHIADRNKAILGFTLIELMITVAIIGILAMVAYPNYQEFVRRGHRSAAQSQMMDIANREQQYLLANRSYATKAQVEASGYALPTDLATRYNYGITLSAGTPPTFQITFTPKGAQSGDVTLDLYNDGRKEPANKW